MSGEYETFLAGKAQVGERSGFKPTFMAPLLKDFQQNLVEWSVEQGRGAVFADCGLGKTPVQLTFAQNVVEKTNRPVLVLAPLGVAAQTVREGAKFGVECSRSAGGSPTSGARVVVTNYEKLHHFSPDDFAGVVCDESGILKSFEGKTRATVTEFLRTIPYRLLCTATASPNDYVELGTHSEALGGLGQMDMLGMFFKNDENSLHPKYNGSKWRFKSHAESSFWRWVCSWARAVRKPSDLGFDDAEFVLPPLETHTTIVRAPGRAPGLLFDLPAEGLQEQRDERKRTVTQRCEAVARLNQGLDSSVAWCHLNVEGDLLEKIVPGSVQVSGDDSDDEKEEKFLAFSSGQARVMIVKPKIGAWGLNWQHCAHQTFFPSHSFEQYYQGVRRVWRFGQKRKVRIDVVTSEGEANVMQNLQRKADAADAMFTALVAYMNDALGVKRSAYGARELESPSWL